MNKALPAKIMVIGDDSHFCYLMRRYVRESSHPMVFAYAHDNYIEMAQQTHPAAIVLEASLPGSASWQALKALKASPEVSCIPIILCSWEDERAHGGENGVDVYLRMPILFNDFMNALARVGISVDPVD